ncbi:hypothetical protein [Crossiella sp. CA198]|uniref:hypothetical protein n=1 Tax=Crossiella sp. CA198 TaxID=3455607 RepID=UPI003F8D8C25
MSNWTIHIEATRSWWNGSSTTLCGLTITKVEVSGGWWVSVTCPACKAAKKAQRKGGRK